MADSDWEDVLQGLNDAQREAVTTTEGFVRVLAGAGSGKTRALTHRFAYLVEELGILPGNILCVTFTNKAATEMRSRIHALTGDNDTGYINTFHGFCVSILQEDSHAVGYPKSFLVLDNADIDDMLAKIYEERGLTLRDMTYSQARDMFEMRKLVQQPDYYKELIALPLAALKEKYDRAQTKQDILFYGYLYEEKKCFGLDYNDLIKFSLHIFAEHEDIRKKWQQRLEYIMIDEFQDIDAAVPPHERALRLAQEPLRRRRPRPDHLHVARRFGALSSGLRYALPRDKDNLHARELPLDAGNPFCRQLADRQEHEPHREGPCACKGTWP